MADTRDPGPDSISGSALKITMQIYKITGQRAAASLLLHSPKDFHENTSLHKCSH